MTQIERIILFILELWIFDSYSRIGYNEILNIPIPKNLDDDLVEKISAISKDLTEGKFEFVANAQNLCYYLT